VSDRVDRGAGQVDAAVHGRAVRRTIARAVLAALLALVTLWAFVSYLEPVFTGEQAGESFRCN